MISTKLCNYLPTSFQLKLLGMFCSNLQLLKFFTTYQTNVSTHYTNVNIYRTKKIQILRN